MQTSLGWFSMNREKNGIAWSAILSLLLMTTLMTSEAFAHVKWFTQFDNAKAPLSITEVLTKTFIGFFICSVVMVYFFFVADRYAYKKGYLVAFDESLRKLDLLSIHIMRVCAAIFFFSLFGYYQFMELTFFLTPELLTTSKIVPWVHLAIGFCALSRYTMPLVGVGILGLYGAAVYNYGIYHLIDYLIFLGIAYFFMATAITRGSWKKSGFIVLYALMGLTLLWASVEKWGYPYWTYPLLAKDPSLLMGMEPYTYMLLAGFVEFNVIFLLLGAVSIVTRLIALVLEAVVMLAIYKFGLVDAIGHLMIIAVLLVLILRGPTEARYILLLRDKSIWMEAYFMTGLYYFAFVNIFLLYYGLHYFYYGV